MIKYISIFWLVFRCFLVLKKENLTGFSTGLTGWSKNLDPTGFQCRNFVIWGPGANIHYGAPFFSTKRSTGLLFTVQGSLRFFGVFRRLRAIETFQWSHLIFCNIARSTVITK